MAIIIDANCIPCVFSPSNSFHAEFKPVYDWIMEGEGVIVIGGKKYKNELGKISSYLRIFNELKKIGKVVNGNDLSIDEYERAVISNHSQRLFNDEHLVAMVVETKCMLICSNDLSSIKYVQDKTFYPTGFPFCPAYYTGKRNKNLLNRRYVHHTLISRLNKKNM